MSKHLRVPKPSGEEVIKGMRKHSAIDDSYQIIHEGEHLLIPVKEGSEEIAKGLGEIIEKEGRARNRKPQPEGIKGSYDIIGSIVLMKKSNVRDPSKLAENLLKRPGIKTVYLDNGVQGPNRTRNLKLLAGERNSDTIYRENGIELMVDVENAYFSPRLATERMRVSDSVKDGEFIIDLFSGIGPFSILIAKNHSCRIVAVDHNPRAIELLGENIKRNRLMGTIEVSVADAGDEILKHSMADRIIMNLPHGAFPFVSAAMGALKPGGTINFYEVNTVEGIAERMSELRDMGLRLKSKREVHGYSKEEYMYALELEKEREQVA